MTSHRTALTKIAIAMAAAASFIACAGDSSSFEEDTGSINMEVQITPGVTLSTVNWSINNSMTPFTKTGSVNVRFSNTIVFQTGAIPAGPGYTIALSATSVDGSFTCTGSAGFRVLPFIVTPVTLILNCSTTPPAQGGIVVVGTTQLCANLDSIAAAPLETAVNTSVMLSATGSIGSLTPTFSWTATAGTFDNAASANPTFTCPATPGDVTVTVSIAPSAASCNTVTSQSVVVTCDAVTPTFTNVYADIIGVRCIGCHRPGGGGFTVGGLDMSTPAAAYANLVGVNAAGIGAGTSGVTCASVTPPAVRVIPGDSANSLIFNKVHSKLVAGPVLCGSPMPLPATGAPLTAAEVALIAAWIDAGALNN
jgi:hypothetical protein